MSIPGIVHWVDGKPWDGTAGRFAEVTNPATGAVTGRVAWCDGCNMGAASASITL